MAENFGQLNKQQLYYFRFIYAILFVFVFAGFIVQTINQVELLKSEVATDFGERIKVFDTLVLEAEQKVREIASLYNSGALSSDVLSDEKLAQRVLQQTGFYRNRVDEVSVYWNLFGLGNYDNLTPDSYATFKLLFQAGHFLPISIYDEHYPAASLVISRYKQALVYPYFSAESISEQLKRYESGDAFDNFNYIINNYAVASTTEDILWLSPHISFFDGRPALGIATKLQDFKSGEQVGLAYLNVDFENMTRISDSLLDVKASVMFTFNDQQKHHIIRASFDFNQVTSSKNQYLLDSDISLHLPTAIAEQFNLSNEWFVLDDHQLFLLSVPLTNPTFRVTFFADPKQFYLADPKGLIVKILTLIGVLGCGLYLDYLVRSRMVKPMQAMHDELNEEKQKLAKVVEQLKQTQRELVESEKLASLGQLVAGVAHEINTPLGIAVTAASHSANQIERLRAMIECGKISKSEFENSVSEMEEGHQFISRNLKRAADLIHNFKQISTDRTNEDVRRINLADYIEKTLHSLTPELKRHGVTTEFKANCRPTIDTVPGAISQVLTNIILNAAIHAYDKEQSGKINVCLQQAKDLITIVVQDFGKGMSEEVRSHVFDPFFTTRRGKGGTGLGLSISYSLVSQTLKGQIDVQSEVGTGSQFMISIPKSTHRSKSKQVENETV